MHSHLHMNINCWCTARSNHCDISLLDLYKMLCCLDKMLVYMEPDSLAHVVYIISSEEKILEALVAHFKYARRKRERDQIITITIHLRAEALAA